MYRQAPPAPPRSASLLESPAALASIVYGLGNVVAALALGAAAVMAEFSPGQGGSDAEGIMAAIALGQGVVWALVMRGIIAFRPWVVWLLLTPCVLGVLFFKLMVLAFGSGEGIRPSIAPHIGELVAVFIDPLLLGSYWAVWRAARHVSRGEVHEGPLTVAVSSLAWLACVSLLGVVIAPLMILRAVAALALTFAVLGIFKARGQLTAGDRANEPEPGARKGADWGSALARGGGAALIGGVILAILRLGEQRSTLDPAIRAVYRDQSMFDHCYVKRSSVDKSGVVLVKVDCGGGSGPVLAWDPDTDKLLEGERLYERVPSMTPEPVERR